MTQPYIVHYGELGLKGRNRIHFEQRLISNIQQAFGEAEDVKVSRFHSYLMVWLPDTIPASEAEDRLRRLFGIAYFAPTTVIPRGADHQREMALIQEAALELATRRITPETTFRIRTTRGDKHFPIKSMEVDRRVGAAVVDATGAPVDLTEPDVTVSIQIYEDGAYLFVDRIPGPGGLPVGSSGRVIALFSGGIDSPVAAHMLMKRGCAVDFLHFHLLPNTEQIRSAKIVAMAKRILAPHRTPARLYMVSSAPFEAAMAGLNARVATVVFRRFVVRAADQLARYRDAPALVTGESVGQVASQTLQNINLIARATSLPILRPLIGMDKLEIINIAKEIGTYELSIQPYRDPCSLHARNPATWGRLSDVLEVETEIGVNALLQETLDHHVEEIRISFD